MAQDNGQQKSTANWVKTQVLDNNVTVSISDKGSIMFRQTDNNRFLFCFQQRDAETIVNLSGDLANILVSDEYKAIVENKAKNKEAAYLQKKVATHILKAQQMAQAAIDALKASGMTEEQAKQVLKVS